MSEFWANNKGSIMSGIATAGKYSYQGTKFVAKTGYSAAKTQYHNSASSRKKDDQSSELETTGPVTSLSNLSDPSLFPPPPLKPGQKQYTSQSSVSLNDTDHSRATTNVSISGISTEPLNESCSVESVQPACMSPNTGYSRAPAPLPVPVGSEGLKSNGDASTVVVPKTGDISQQPVRQQPIQDMACINSNSKAPPSIPHRVLPSAPSAEYRRPPANIPVEHNVPTSSASETSNSKSVSPSISVSPYQWTDADDRKQKKRLEIAPVDVDSFKPPPMHRDRPQVSQSKGMPQEQRTSFRRTTSDLSALSQASSKSSLVTPEDKVGKVVNNSISGKYQEPEATFAPPPKPPSSHFPVQQKVVSANSRNPAPVIEATTLNKTEKPFLPSRTEGPLSQTTRGRRTNHQLEGKSDPEQHSAVLGKYNYEINIAFAPPPKPFKSNESLPPAKDKNQFSTVSVQNECHGNVPQLVEPSLNPTNENLVESFSTMDFAQAIANPLLPPPVRRQVTTNVRPSPALPNRTFDCPPRYSTMDSLPQYDEILTQTHSPTETLSTGNKYTSSETGKKIPPPIKPKSSSLQSINPKKSPPIVPKKNPSLQTNLQKPAPPKVPRKKFTLAELETKLHENSTAQLANESKETNTSENDDDDSIDNNPFRIYMKNAVPKDYDHIHKHD